MNRRTKIFKNKEDFIPLKRREKKKKVRLAKPTSDEKDELFRSGYEWLDKLETNISKVTAKDSSLLSMVSRVSCDSMKNIISYKRKKYLVAAMFRKKQRQTQIAKYQLLCHQTKVNFISQKNTVMAI